MKINFENIDGFVIDLTTSESVLQKYKEIYNLKTNLPLEEMRKLIVNYYTQTYDIVLCKDYNVYQVIEDKNIIFSFENKKKTYHTDLVVASLEKRCHKIFFNNGFFFLEKFDEDEEIDNTYDREERERAKLYDEYGYYLDYISLDGKTNKEYWGIISDFLKSKTGLELLCKLDIDEEKIMGHSIEEVMLAYANSLEDEDGTYNEEAEEIHERLKDKNWAEKDFITCYNIQKLGEVYFIVLI